MADHFRKPKSLRELVDESRFWDASDLLRNFDEEMDRIEHGLGHAAWDSTYRPVSMCMRPLPTVPRFEMSETREKLTLRVYLPGVPPENLHVDVDKRDVEVFACSDDPICKPYYLSVESQGSLDPDSAEVVRDGPWVEVKVPIAKKRRLEIRELAGSR